MEHGYVGDIVAVASEGDAAALECGGVVDDGGAFVEVERVVEANSKVQVGS